MTQNDNAAIEAREWLELTHDPLDPARFTEFVKDSRAGAVAMFEGTTRDNAAGRPVLRLEYEAYEPRAKRTMARLVADLRRNFPGVLHVALAHRLGHVPTGETSIVVAASAPHRRAALDAVSALLDAAKSELEVWKREVLDGQGAPGEPAGEWLANCECGRAPATWTRAV